MLCTKVGGSQLLLGGNPGPNAAPQNTHELCSLPSPGRWYPTRSPQAPVDEDKEGDADGEALLADADGLQDPRVPQLTADHVGLEEPRLLGRRWGEASAPARADPCPPHSPCRRRQAALASPWAGKPQASSHLFVVGFETAHKEGVAPAMERTRRSQGTGDKASLATSGSDLAVTLLLPAWCMGWLPTLPTLTSPSFPPGPGATAGTGQPRWEPCTAASWCCSS